MKTAGCYVAQKLELFRPASLNSYHRSTDNNSEPAVGAGALILLLPTNWLGRTSPALFVTSGQRCWSLETRLRSRPRSRSRRFRLGLSVGPFRLGRRVPSTRRSPRLARRHRASSTQSRLHRPLASPLPSARLPAASPRHLAAAPVAAGRRRRAPAAPPRRHVRLAAAESARRRRRRRPRRRRRRLADQAVGLPASVPARQHRGGGGVPAAGRHELRPRQPATDPPRAPRRLQPRRRRRTTFIGAQRPPHRRHSDDMRARGDRDRHVIGASWRVFT